jgi:hypothetical protein
MQLFNLMPQIEKIYRRLREEKETVKKYVLKIIEKAKKHRNGLVSLIYFFKSIC